jgi:hypothetical protein
VPRRPTRFLSIPGALAALALWATALSAQIVTAADRAAQNREIPQAAEALDTWIGLIEARAFEAAWAQSSELFKRDKDRNMWVTTLYRFRDSISPVKRRELLGTTYTKLLRPVSTADAVTFQMIVHFVNETLGVETVVFMKEADGVYRVASYDFNRGPVITTPAPLGY